ncbi:putative esterase C31F10.02 [Erysiphe neolycopersici]|uniref:Putative esterase C31F10.02 n=1 Tax=Erysiphe neolycopersici TaxID=212602 RepID=A0A420HFE6_9PEZI|nr:putative esterase C31F10.02 [Erysiphe neolycopersici]
MNALSCAKYVLNHFLANSGLESRLFGKNIRITSAEPGRVEFELNIKKEHTNRLEIIHGGTIASLVDLGGSLAVASKGLFGTGVSTDLNVTYLRPGGQVGDVLKAVAICDKLGKSMAYTNINFINCKGEISARGSHTKFLTDASKDMKFPADYEK